MEGSRRESQGGQRREEERRGRGERMAEKGRGWPRRIK